MFADSSNQFFNGGDKDTGKKSRLWWQLPEVCCCQQHKIVAIVNATCEEPNHGNISVSFCKEF